MSRFSVETVFKAVDRLTAPVTRMQNRVGKFTRSMQRGLRSVNRTISKTIRGVRSMATKVAAAGAVLATGFVLAVGKVADQADRLAKVTRRIAFPIEDFQEWVFVGEQSGVSMDLLEKSMGAFTKRLGEARAGSGALTTLLKKSDPAFLKQLLTVESTSTAFEMYLDHIRNAKTATDKAAIASAGFSRAGLKLINITHNSADAVRALRLEQRQNGVITQQQAEAAEAYNDAVNSLKRAVTGLLQGALLPLMPALTQQVTAWRELIVANKQVINLKTAEFFKQVFAALRAVAKGFAFMAQHRSTIVKVVASVVSLIVVLKALGVVMAVVNLVMMANPFGMIVVAIGLVVAAVAGIIIWWDELKASFKSLPVPIIAAVAALTGPIGWFAGAALLVWRNWEPLKAMFKNLWSGVVDIFERAAARIGAIVDKVKGLAKAAANVAGKVKSAVGGRISSVVNRVENLIPGRQGPDDADTRDTAPRIVSPQDRVARTIEESRSTSSAEVTIRDETSRAEVTRGTLGSNISLQPTGAF